MTSCSITDPYYLNLKEKRQQDVKIHRIDTVLFEGFNSHPLGVYSLNSTEFKNALVKSLSDFTLVIFFTDWCPNSKENVPYSLNGLKSVNGLEIVLVSPDDWIRSASYFGYMKKYKLDLNIYLLDVYSYGEKRNPHYRMKSFISEICDSCAEIGGFPSIIIFDSKNSIILKQSGKIDSEGIISFFQNK
jgi:hypothetical protein